jgi:hypothetical protein
MSSKNTPRLAKGLHSSKTDEKCLRKRKISKISGTIDINEGRGEGSKILFESEIDAKVSQGLREKSKTVTQNILQTPQKKKVCTNNLIDDDKKVFLSRWLLCWVNGRRR